MVQCYNEYRSIWENPYEDNELIYECEVGNPCDTHTVACLLIAGESFTVGYISGKISCVCSIFIRCNV